jgi:hypothetical protein
MLNSKLQIRLLAREGAAHHKSVKSKNNSRKEEKLVAGSKGVPDTKRDWPNDHRS